MYPDRHFVPAPPPQKTVWGLTAPFLLWESTGSLDRWNVIMPYKGGIN